MVFSSLGVRYFNNIDCIKNIVITIYPNRISSTIKKGLVRILTAPYSKIKKAVSLERVMACVFIL